MTKLDIRKRLLTDAETGLVSEELHKFQHVGFISPHAWKNFQRQNEIYVAEVGGKLVGLCMVVKLRQWFKIGPLVIFKSCQGKGLGKKLFNFVIKHHARHDLYVGSSNPRIWKLARDSGFKEQMSYWVLPGEIKLYLINYFFERLNWVFMVDALSKGFRRGSRYRYFLRYAGFRP